VGHARHDLHIHPEAHAKMHKVAEMKESRDRHRRARSDLWRMIIRVEFRRS
jgi:hypothetical protein